MGFKSPDSDSIARDFRFQFAPGQRGDILGSKEDMQIQETSKNVLRFGLQGPRQDPEIRDNQDMRLDQGFTMMK